MRIAGVIIIVLLLVQCSSDNDVDPPERSIAERKLIKQGTIFEYVPNSIDLSKNLDSLLQDDTLRVFYVSEDEIILDSITNTVLLKLYLFHLKKANQGYNLQYMSKGNAEYLIEYFLNRNALIEQELVTSGAAYELAKRGKLLGTFDKSLIDSIDVESERISEWAKDVN